MPERTHLAAAAWNLRQTLAQLARQRLDLIVAMLVLVGGTWGFIELADNVLEGETQAFDEAVLRALRGGGELGREAGPEWLRQSARDITALGSIAVLLIVTLAAAGYLALVRNYTAMVLVLAATWTGQIVCLALKAGLDRARPDVVAHWDDVATASFPSGHAMMAAVVYLTLGVMLANLLPGRRRKTYVVSVAALVTFLVGASRIVLGVHYPTDVLAGWTAGLVWALLCGLGASLYQRWARGKRGGTASV